MILGYHHSRSYVSFQTYEESSSVSTHNEDGFPLTSFQEFQATAKLTCFRKHSILF